MKTALRFEGECGGWLTLKNEEFADTVMIGRYSLSSVQPPRPQEYLLYILYDTRYIR
ncbi:hypothetical protein KDAU_39230 [Dictyobacter aurantiacus]|uniref:Uncharacterized protein n=1 Tax=Dictyobacter aurantiacus TaxID=1936993 RepID=A0A401ZIC8_9CHLR|nr:hypothetical protein KDAU_39230 [Dictyobacter aurantiacus]